MAKTEYGPYCKCGHDKDEHFFGDGPCSGVDGGMGPADNMDVWEEYCLCPQFEKEWESEDDVQ